MASIYEIQDKYKLIQSLIEDGADSELFTAALNEIDGELSEKLENYAMIITNIQSNVDGKKFEAKRLLERAKNEEESIKRMKLVMQEAVIASGNKTVKTEKFNFTVQKNPPSLNILDENLVPRKFIEIEQVIKIDKKAILSDLKNGEFIPGVEKTQGESLRIR